MEEVYGVKWDWYHCSELRRLSPSPWRTISFEEFAGDQYFTSLMVVRDETGHSWLFGTPCICEISASMEKKGSATISREAYIRVDP